MEYRKLGKSGLEVSELALGTMQFGWTADAETAFAILDAYVEAGGNLIDTADIYSRWVEGNPGGVSEGITGRWMKDRQNRQELVVATKVRGRMWEGPNGEGLSRAHIVRAVEDSLRRLQTDHIDLYQMHHVDRDTPWDEIWQAMEQLVREGKVLYVGSSNFAALHLAQAQFTAQARSFLGLVSEQSLYHLNCIHLIMTLIDSFFDIFINNIIV